MKKKMMALFMTLSVAAGTAGCSTSTAATVNYNLSKDANEFNVYDKLPLQMPGLIRLCFRQKDICRLAITARMNW